MNASTLVTSLTAVIVLLTGSFGWADVTADAAAKDTREECEAMCTTVEYAGACGANPEKPEKKEDAVRVNNEWENCKEKLVIKCKAVACSSKDNRVSNKEKIASCETSVKDWKDTAGKSAGACDDFEKVKSSSNTCENRIKACEKKISETARLINTSEGATGSTGGTMDVLLQFYAQKNNIDPKQFNKDGELLNTTNCVKFSNDKVEERREKQETKLEKIDDKIKEIKRKIAEHEKDIAKENENLRKENATLDEEKEKIQTTYAENVAKIDVKKREKYTALNKSIQDNLVKIRNMNSVIITLKEKLEKLKFDYNQNMINFAEDKVSSKCDDAVRAANSCFTRLNKGEKIDMKDQNCGGLSATGKGITGTGVLKTRLTQIRNACFENFTMQQNSMRYDHQTKVRTLEQEILEKQNQIKDLNNAANLEKQEFDAITAENEKEKTNETDSKTKKESNLAAKLESFTKTMNEKIANSQKQLDILTKEIEELVTRKLPGTLGIIPDAEGNNVTVSFKEARKAIEASELSRIDAYEKCGCEKDATNKICTKLKDAATSKENERGRGAVNIRNKR